VCCRTSVRYGEGGVTDGRNALPTSPKNNLHMLYSVLKNVKVLGLILGFGVVVTVFSILADNFLTLTNLIQVIRQSSFIGIMALGTVFVLSEGDVDISISGIYNLVGILTAFSLEQGQTVGVSVAAGLAVGLLCGLANISFSLLFNMPTFIITLGTMNIYRGLGLVISKARSIYDFPKDHFFYTVIGGSIGKVPFTVIALIFLTVVLGVVYRHTRFGIHVRAIGGNMQVARAMGVKIVRTRVIVLMLNGALSAIAAIMQVAFMRSADPSIGVGHELMVIASAIIGGTALAGGSGSVLGAMIGGVLIALIRNGIVFLGVTAYWGYIVTGGIIIMAVAIDYMSKQAKFFSVEE
jgi:ribose transport system permease protein